MLPGAQQAQTRRRSLIPPGGGIILCCGCTTMLLWFIALLLIPATPAEARAIKHLDGADTYTALLHFSSLSEARDGNHTVRLFGQPVVDPLTDLEAVPHHIKLNAPDVIFTIQDTHVVRIVVTAQPGVQHLGPFSLKLSSDPKVLEVEQEVEEQMYADGEEFETSDDVSEQPQQQQPLTKATILDVFSDHQLADHEVGFDVDIPLTTLHRPSYYLRCDVYVRRMTVFEHTFHLDDLADKIPTEVVPANSSFGVRFLVLKNAKANTVGVWVKRRPPIPNYILRVFNVLPLQSDNGNSNTTVSSKTGCVTNAETSAKQFPIAPSTNSGTRDTAPPQRIPESDSITLFPLAQATLSDVHPRGVGIDDVMIFWKAELEAMKERYVKEEDRPEWQGVRLLDSVNALVLKLRVEFEEFSRQHHEVFEVPNAESMMATLRLHDGSMTTLDPIDPDADENEDEDLKLKHPSEMVVGEHMLDDDRYMKAQKRRSERIQNALVRCRLQYINHTSHIALMILQRVHIDHLQVHVVDAENHTLFLEEEWHVPFAHEAIIEQRAANVGDSSPPVGAHAVPLHFGWYHFKPISGEWIQQLKDKKMAIHVFFNTVSEEKHHTPPAHVGGGPHRFSTATNNAGRKMEQALVEHLGEWLVLHGATGAVKALQATTTRTGSWVMEFRHNGDDVAARKQQHIGKGDVLATIPNSVIIDFARVKRNMHAELKELIEGEPWEEFVARWTTGTVATEEKKNEDGDDDELFDTMDHLSTPSTTSADDSTSQHRDTLTHYGLQLSKMELHYIALAAFILARPEDLHHGMRYQLVRDAMHLHRKPNGFVNNKLVFPPIVADDMFHILPESLHSLAKTAKALQLLYLEEYAVLNATWPSWFGHRVSSEEYFNMRLSIGSRAFVLANEPMLVPLVDRCAHSGDPTIELRKGSEGAVDVVALRGTMKEGRLLTMDFGSATRTKQSFWNTYGLVPSDAQDAVDVDGVLLSAISKSSRAPLLHAMDSDLHSLKERLERRRQELPDHLPHNLGLDADRAGLLKYPSTRAMIVSHANEVLFGMHVALTMHLRWVQEDIHTRDGIVEDEG